MNSNFENLIKAGMLKREKINKMEIMGLLESGKVCLKDACNAQLSEESQFDLTYNAAHSLALAALRLKGYRPTNRYVVFQTLPLTLSVGPEVWRVLSKCHDKRNLAEYEGHWESDMRFLKEVITATEVLLHKVNELNKK